MALSAHCGATASLNSVVHLAGLSALKAPRTTSTWARSPSVKEAPSRSAGIDWSDALSIPPSLARERVGSSRQSRKAVFTKGDFVGEIADLAAKSFGANARDCVVLVAPARLIEPLRQRLRGRMNIIATQSKDLTKIADHDLAAHLAPLLRAHVA